MGFRGSVQLDHVALQVLLLHELLGARGTLEKAGTVSSSVACTISALHGEEGPSPEPKDSP